MLAVGSHGCVPLLYAVSSFMARNCQRNGCKFGLVAELYTQ